MIREIEKRVEELKEKVKEFESLEEKVKEYERFFRFYRNFIEGINRIEKFLVIYF